MAKANAPSVSLLTLVVLGLYTSTLGIRYSRLLWQRPGSSIFTVSNQTLHHVDQDREDKVWQHGRQKAIYTNLPIRTKNLGVIHC